MKRGGKKGIVIAIILVLFIAILAGGVYAYLTTDLFKSNQTLFFKYMGQTLGELEDTENTQNTQIEQIEQKKQTTPYEVTGNLQYFVGEENVNPLELGIEAKVDKAQEKTYAKANLNYQKQNLFTVEYANSNQIYALKSDEIVTAFLGIENNNLKVLAQKLGITDTTNIPDTINFTNVTNLLKISKEEKEHIQETYLAVLMDNISQDNFKKEKEVSIQKKNVDYVTTAYRLELSKSNLIQLNIAVLEKLKEDSITLNLIATKAKMLGLDENYTQINLLTNQIQTKIDTLKQDQTLEEEGLLTISVYTNQGKVIATEIKVRNELKYTIYGTIEENKKSYCVLIEDFSEEANYNKIQLDIKERRADTGSNYQILININNDLGIDLFIENAGASQNLITKCEANIYQTETNQTIHLNYEQEIRFVEELTNMIELNRNNCGVLNDYTTEQLQPLLQAISQKMGEVMSQKLQIIIYIMAQQAVQQARPEINNTEQQLQNTLQQVESSSNSVF